MPEVKYVSLYGTVDWQGYTIWGRNPNPTRGDTSLKNAGNCPYEYKQVLHYDDPDRMSADRIREHCQTAGEEMAIEMELEFTDVSDSGGWAW